MAYNGGRPKNLPGVSRDNAVSRPIDPSVMMRALGTVGSWLGQGGAGAARELPFFPPGVPMQEVAPSARGRAWDYPTAINQQISVRPQEAISYETLRQVSDPALGGWDLIRLAIETRKDQIAKLTFSVLPRKAADAHIHPKPTPACERIEKFMRKPDGINPWETWSRMLLEEQLVTDAATIYRRRALDGSLAKLELIDGATIIPRLGYDGRRPDSGAAYTQVIKGMPAVNYEPDELIFAPRNPRVHKIYGFSCVEQVIVTINIGLRRQVSQLGYFTEGSVPDAVAQVPPEWTVDKIKEYQEYWDTMVNDFRTRRKLKFIPGGMGFQATRSNEALTDQFDEWLARIVQYCFSLPPTPLVRMMNRATSENAYEQSLDEGLQPLMIWLKNIVDRIISEWFGEADLELVWDDIKKVDPAEKEQRDLPMVEAGVISRDDMRAERGMEPLGLPPIVQGIGPLGFMSVTAMKLAIDNGWDLNGPPQPMMPGMGGEMGPGMDGSAGGLDINQMGTGGEGDPLADLPPEILETLGLGQPGGGAPQGMPQRAPQGAPASGGAEDGNVVPLHRHPVVLEALRTGEAHARRIAARMHQ